MEVIPLRPLNLLSKLLALVVGLVVLGLLYTLIGRVLSILPTSLKGALGAGVSQLGALLGPALGPAAALLIIGGAAWLLLSGRR